MHVVGMLAGLMALAGPPEKLVINHARMLDQPHYWGRAIGDVERGMTVTVLEERAAWVKVRTQQRSLGFVPRSAFEDALPMELHFDGKAPTTASIAQAANASRGFSKEVNQADIAKANLTEADAWINRYETGPLLTELPARMPAFLRDGALNGSEK
jgi:hypothetical protein